jgi:predicted nucleic acid-binding protein
LIIYLDTSALLKQYVQETGSEEVGILLESAEVVGTVIVTYVEMASAIARAVRMKMIPSDEARKTWEDFLVDWGLLVRLDVSGQLAKRAAALAWEHGLRGYDAIHLATALSWEEAMDVPVKLATYDHELWLAAQGTGMEVWPGK